MNFNEKYKDIKGIEKLVEMDSCFSWDNITHIKSIFYNVEYDNNYIPFSVLKLCLIYERNNKIFDINIEFKNITNLNLKKIGGLYNQIMGFEIIDKKNDGYEKEQRFMINDYEDGIINFFCSEIKVISVLEIGRSE